MNDGSTAPCTPGEARGEGEQPLAARLARVRGEIAEATRAAGLEREPELVVVTKFHPASLVRELAGLGERAFGESRHPEARDKRAELPDVDELGARWHFIGQIQTKKARQIARYVDAIHSIDRIGLVEALATAEVARPIDACLQLNLTDDPERGGCREEELDELADAVAACPTHALRGLMAVAPLGEDPRIGFERVARASERLVRTHPAATWRSIGMSGDFQEAIGFGATHLRVGVAITGNRPARA